ncbi:MAG: hypothetical protein MJY47_06315 [Fibrobacter sp.]|nr:hypothetical protein [Fibrobacter sp.]
MVQSKNPVIIVVCVAILLIAAVRIIRSYGDFSKTRAEFEAHEQMIAETNECLSAGEWACAERNVRALLKAEPNDTNLQLHLAHILLEQERYDECVAYVDSRTFSNKDLIYLKEKSQQLKKEMETLGVERSAHFRVEFEGRPARADVLEALTVLEIAYDSLCRLFQFYPENKMHLVLYQTAEYQGMGSRPDWVGAIFDGKLRVPVGLMQYYELYRPILFHELTHAFVRAMNRNSVPLWLNEGVAQVVDGSRTGNPRPEGAPPILEALTEPFVNEKRTENAIRLYWYSQAMVEQLLARDLSPGVGPKFAHIREFIAEIRILGVDKAMDKHYGVTTQKLYDHVISVTH